MGTEVFLVMTNRPANDLEVDFPKIEKTLDMKMYWTEEEAKKHCEFMNKAIGPHYGVYQATIKVLSEVILWKQRTDGEES